MDWITSLFFTHSSVQTVVVTSLIIAVGLSLGKIRIMGVSLGVAVVFFVGILAGNIGLNIDSNILDYAETFGLSLFVYCLGLHVGPNFLGSMRHEGMMLNFWSFAVILVGTLLTLVLVPLTGIDLPNMVGLLCGATTNTPALGAATQALAHLGKTTGSVALATAVTYPLGVVGVILAMVLLRKWVAKPQDLPPHPLTEDDHTYIEQVRAVNPAIMGKTIQEVASMTHIKFIVSRIWRNGQAIVAEANTLIEGNDQLLVITNKEDEQAIQLLFGEKMTRDWNREQIDWNAIDANLESRVCVVTREALNGRRLGQLQMRNAYGVNVSRIIRGDIKLLASDDLRLQYGDRVTVVGKHEDVDHAENFLGNSVKTLEEPNIGSIFLGIVLGLALGTIPFSLPGMDSPIRLGMAGGPIIMGIVMGALGPRIHIISYTTRSASLMLRKLGLALYLGCLGLDAGSDFFATVIRPEGLLWLGVGFTLTLLPVLLVGWMAMRLHRYDFGTICGIICGSMANPMALTYATENVEGDSPSVAYATVYPIGMFVRVIIAQILIVFLT